jgi:hypothetical protein
MRMQNGIKYDIGKIYHMNNSLTIHRFAALKFEELNLTSELKIYDIVVNDKLDSFKIIKEIDYKSFITQNKINVKNFNKISILKLQDEKTINNLIINKERYYFKDILQTNNRKYVDYLIDNEEQLELILFLFLKHNLTNNNLKKLSFSKTWENQYIVADVGRQTDLDTLQKTTNDREIIGAILRNGRTKDIDKYITSNDSYLLSRIADTGIDKYLDVLVKNKKDDLTGAPILRCVLNHGRKKDIEKFKNSIFNQDLIKDFTDDDILNLR